MFLLCLSAYALMAQELPKVIPPSPTAASLGQYGEVPVSNYTGVIGISVPLYEIKSGEITCPMSISYHASGIKVAQEASSVGLGWTLNAGGVITRSVLGVDDLKSQKGYTEVEDLESTDSDLPANYSIDDDDYQDYLAINGGSRDGQPDILYYNFMGLSGKMIFDKKDESTHLISGIPLEQTNMQFVYDTDDEMWEVTDANGWKYFFSVQETSQNHNSRELYSSSSYSTGRFLYDVDRMDQLSSQVPDGRFISSWFLNKILTPKGDEVAFEYDQEDEHKGINQMSYYEQESYYGDPLNSRDENLWYGYFTERKYSVTANMQSYDNVNLKRITFENGYVEFETSDREDVRAQYYSSGAYYDKPQKIDAFEVFDLDGRSVKRVEFKFSYFNESVSGDNHENYWRLKLDEVQEHFYNEAMGFYERHPPYTFDYNDVKLPAKSSAAIDHWGYYNGADNDNTIAYGDITRSLYDGTTYGFPGIVNITEDSDVATAKYFMPFQIACGPSSSATLYPFSDGAYREPDVNKMQAAVLEQINYPTGGATRLSYSPNQYVPPTDVDFERYEYNTIYLNHEGLGEADTKDFTLNDYSWVKIYCDLDNAASSIGSDDIDALITTSSGEEVLRFAVEGSALSFQEAVQAILPPGSYQAILQTKGGGSIIEMDMTIEFVQRFWTDEKVGGGLRIDTQETLDMSGNVVKKKIYQYQNGRAMTEVQHFYKDVGFDSESFLFLNPSPALDLAAENVIVRSSNTEIPLSSSAQGNFVGYDKVSVSDVDQQGNLLGKSDYYYVNTPDEKGNGIFNLPGFPVTIHMNNGQLLKEYVFNNEGDTLKKTENVFFQEDASTTMVKGIYTRNILKNPPDASSSGGPMVRFYRIYSEWWHEYQTKQTLYSTTGEDPVTTVTTSYYDNPAHKNLTARENVNSKGRLVKSVYQYPPDLVDQEQSVLMQTMIDLNLISQPVITETFIDDVKISETHVKFEDSEKTGGIPLPVEIHAVKGATDIDISQKENLKIIYYKYDDKGNPLEVSKVDDLHFAYIWGYNNAFPIAQIQNATDGEVACTSFENNAMIGWDLSNVNIQADEELSKTGKACALLTESSSISAPALASGQTYVVEFFARSSISTAEAQIKVNNSLITLDGYYRKYQVIETASTINIVLEGSMSAYIDEVRIYPLDARITTYTYAPLIGVTSETDPNGRSKYFEYDLFTRLQRIRDEEGNILKTYEYNYVK